MCAARQKEIEVCKLDADSNTCRRIYNPQDSPFCNNSDVNNNDEFVTFLKVNKKRNIRQIVSYALRFHSILETQDASPIVNLQSGALKRHAMESLTLLAKHRGISDKWTDIRKRYSLKWSGGDNGSVQSLQRFFDESKTMDKMIQWVKQAIAVLLDNKAAILRYNVLTGLRPVEAL